MDKPMQFNNKKFKQFVMLETLIKKGCIDRNGIRKCY